MEIRKVTSSHRGSYRTYDHEDLTRAFNMVKEDGLSANKAAITCGVPVSTLKDRLSGKIGIDVLKSGPETLFTQEQEAHLSQHFILMAEIGYGYSRQEAVNVASEYAVHLGLRTKQQPLSLRWLHEFKGRWPDLKVVLPRGLEAARAKCATRPTIDRYFEELEKTLNKYDLKDKPGHLFNIDEKGLNCEHKPPRILAGKHYKAQAITSGRSQTITVIGGGNAAGQQVPPFFVFPGSRMMPALLDGATAGTSGTVTESGWSNTAVFEKYMTEHLIKYLPSRDENHVLVLYDGHKSHVSLGLIEWARSQKIILFVLPPHCSHLLQPMDVSCYGPLENAWNAACHHYMRESGGRLVTRYDVCRIGCKAYLSTLTPANLQAAFRRCGIFPFNSSVIGDDVLAPSLTFPTKDLVPAVTPVTANQIDDQDPRSFLEKRGGEVLKNVQAAKIRRTLSKVVGGKEITDEVVIDEIRSHIDRVQGKKNNKKAKKTQPLCPKAKQVPKQKTKTKCPKPSVTCCPASKSTQSRVFEPVPGPSGLVALNNPEDTTDSESDYDESEKCIVCKRSSPEELRHCINLVILTWGQCDKCNGWVHLKFCSPVRVLRRGDAFLCPTCSK